MTVAGERPEERVERVYGLDARWESVIPERREYLARIVIRVGRPWLGDDDQLRCEAEPDATGGIFRGRIPRIPRHLCRGSVIEELFLALLPANRRGTILPSTHLAQERADTAPTHEPSLLMPADQLCGCLLPNRDESVRPPIRQGQRVQKVQPTKRRRVWVTDDRNDPYVEVPDFRREATDYFLAREQRVEVCAVLGRADGVR
jgi:hypothetical protein